MIKASSPVVKDGLGILARLVVIAMLLSILSALLQGCSECTSVAKEEIALVKVQAQESLDVENIGTVLLRELL